MADLKEKTYVEDVDRSVYDIRDEEHDAYRMKAGLTPEIVDALSKEKEITLELKSYSQAGIFKSYDKINYLYLVMPVRI